MCWWFYGWLRVCLCAVRCCCGADLLCSLIHLCDFASWSVWFCGSHIGGSEAVYMAVKIYKWSADGRNNARIKSGFIVSQEKWYWSKRHGRCRVTGQRIRALGQRLSRLNTRISRSQAVSGGVCGCWQKNEVSSETNLKILFSSATNLKILFSSETNLKILFSSETNLKFQSLQRQI